MGIFGKKTPSEDRDPAILAGDESYSFDEVVGEPFYRDALLGLIADATPEERSSGEVFKKALIAKEPNNEYDRNAIVVRIDGQKVGHIAKEVTSDIHSVLSSLGTQGFNDFGFICDAVIGWNVKDQDAPIGVRLDLNMQGEDEDEA